MSEEIQPTGSTKPGSPDAVGTKLQFFEGEVRKLESQLTQQKVSYENKIKALQEQLEHERAKNAGESKILDAGMLACTLSVDKLADDLNEEVSCLTMDMPANYDWRVVSLVQQAGQQMGSFIEKVLGMGQDAAEEQTRMAFKKLDSRLQLCGAQLLKRLQEAPKPSSGNQDELEKKNAEILALETKLKGLSQVSSTPDHLIKDAEKLNQKLTKAMMDNNMKSSEMLEGLEYGAKCISKWLGHLVAAQVDDRATDVCEKLTESLRAFHLKVADDIKQVVDQASQEGSAAQTASQTEINKLHKRLSEIETDYQEKSDALLKQETEMMALTDQVEAHQRMEEKLRSQLSEMEDIVTKAEEFKAEQFTNIRELQTMNENLESLKSQADEEINNLQGLLTEADNQLKQVEQRMGPLEDENAHLQQRFQQNELLVASVKKDFQQILNYKSDLEVLIEEQTQHMETKNQRLYQLEEQRAHKDTEIDNLENQVRRQTGLADENRKKLLQVEVKLRQLTQATLKDLRAKVKDKNAEIEVLKEMVKSANMQAKSKDIDVSRLQKKINRLQRGGNEDTTSNYGGSRRGRDDGSVSSRQSRLGGGVSPAPNNHMNNNLVGLDGTIQERDAELEQTGAYDYRGQGSVSQNRLPPMNKTNQQEWEEAVELDRILEAERNASSKAKLAAQQDNNFNQYMERIANPNLKNQSSGLGGVLGSSATPSPYYNGSLPDLKQAKRESLEAELLSNQSSHAKTVGRRGRGSAANGGSQGVSSNRGRF